jgi:hypothetical protein
MTFGKRCPPVGTKLKLTSLHGAQFDFYDLYRVLGIWHRNDPKNDRNRRTYTAAWAAEEPVLVGGAMV